MAGGERVPGPGTDRAVHHQSAKQFDAVQNYQKLEPALKETKTFFLFLFTLAGVSLAVSGRLDSRVGLHGAEVSVYLPAKHISAGGSLSRPALRPQDFQPPHY